MGSRIKREMAKGSAVILNRLRGSLERCKSNHTNQAGDKKPEGASKAVGLNVLVVVGNEGPCVVWGSVRAGKDGEQGQEKEVWDDGGLSEKAQSKAGHGCLLLCPPGEMV